MHLVWDQGIVGSNPITPTIFSGSSSVCVEHLAWDQGVGGSNPPFQTILIYLGENLKIKIMPDFFSTGIWNKTNGIMIEFESLGLDSDLCKEFENWIKFYSKSTNELGVLNKNAVYELNKMGLSLSKKIKQARPSDEIFYVGENEKGILKPKLVK